MVRGDRTRERRYCQNLRIYSVAMFSVTMFRMLTCLSMGRPPCPPWVLTVLPRLKKKLKLERARVQVGGGSERGSLQ